MISLMRKAAIWFATLGRLHNSSPRPVTVWLCLGLFLCLSLERVSSTVKHLSSFPLVTPPTDQVSIILGAYLHRTPSDYVIFELHIASPASPCWLPPVVLTLFSSIMQPGQTLMQQLCNLGVVLRTDTGWVVTAFLPPEPPTAACSLWRQGASRVFRLILSP